MGKLNGEMNAIIKSPDFREKAGSLGGDLVGGPPEQLGAYLAAEVAKFQRLVRDAKITAE